MREMLPRRGHTEGGSIARDARRGGAHELFGPDVVASRGGLCGRLDRGGGFGRSPRRLPSQGSERERVGDLAGGALVLERGQRGIGRREGFLDAAEFAERR